MSFTIRAVDTKKEAERLGDGQVRAFRLGDPKLVAAYYRLADFIVAGDTLVAEENGVLAALATSARLTMRIAGADVPCGGITLVGTAPEHRRKGAVGRLMRALLVKMRKEKARAPVSALYPFYAPFYAKFGYARVDWPESFTVPPSQFRPSDLRRHVRRLDPEKDLPAMAAGYERWRAERTGPLARGDYWWRARILGKIEDGVVYAPPSRGAAKGQIEGYLLYATSGGPNEIGSELTVKEHIASTVDGRRALFGFLSTLGDQFEHIHVVFPRGEGPAMLTGTGPVTDARCVRHQVMGSVLAGAMLRIVDLRAALAVHPGPGKSGVQGALGIELTDPVFADQTASWDLAIGARGASAVRGKKAKARLAMTIGDLSQVYLGATRARTLLAAGAIAGDDDAAGLLDAAFAGPVPFWSELNGF